MTSSTTAPQPIPSAGDHSASGSATPQSPPPPHHSQSPSSHSLAAAATLNAGIQTEDSRRSSPGSPLTHSMRNRGLERRRSGVRMNLNFNDPTIPSPGEMAITPGSLSRHSSIGGYPGIEHHRAPSLGELHQELENEQEAQVNRLLALIRQQQAQIAALQTSSTAAGVAVDDSTPTSERSLSLPQPSVPVPVPTPATAVDPVTGRGRGGVQRSTSRPRSPFSHSGARSRTSSYGGYNRTPSLGGSPRLRPTMDDGLGIVGGLDRDRERDETAFYQAETQNLTRENQMLKLRIRELERQLAETSLTSPVPHSPSIPSHLNESLEESEEQKDEARAEGSGSVAAA